MTEREKMLAGQEYDSRDPELIALYRRARTLLRRYNGEGMDNLDVRAPILQELLGHYGQNSWIETPFMCDYGVNIHIGDNVFINYGVVLLDDNTITIGDNSLIGPQTGIYTALHPLHAADRLYRRLDHTIAYRTASRPVTLGKNCWIGGNVSLLPGVTIGDNVTIGSGSVVTHDIPSNHLAYGNPCRIIRPLVPTKEKDHHDM